MACWLLKTEPSAYSYEDLAREKRTSWDGVGNPVALKHLRAAKRGDDLVVYHTGDERAAVGLAKVLREAYAPDERQEKQVVIDIAAAERLPRPVGLAELKGHAAFRDSPLVRQGRLSVVPLTAEQWDALLHLAGAR